LVAKNVEKVEELIDGDLIRDVELDPSNLSPSSSNSHSLFTGLHSTMVPIGVSCVVLLALSARLIASIALPPITRSLCLPLLLGTYTGKSDTAVTALGGGTGLLLIEPSQATTGGLDDASPVGLGVVRQTAAVSETLSHLLQSGRKQ
jgi:hypothetical protein